MDSYRFNKNDFIKTRDKIRSEKDAFWMAFEDNSDRAFAIVVASVLDDLLIDILRASYVEDPKVKVLFKDDHILQSFQSKINISYFSGLIPESVFHDLKLICGIRNKFAHGVTTNLTFMHNSIIQSINKMKFGYEPLPEGISPRLKYTLAVTRIVSALQAILTILSMARPLHLVELLGLNKFPTEKDQLSENEIRSLLRGDK